MFFATVSSSTVSVSDTVLVTLSVSVTVSVCHGLSISSVGVTVCHYYSDTVSFIVTVSVSVTVITIFDMLSFHDVMNYFKRLMFILGTWEFICLY